MFGKALKGRNISKDKKGNDPALSGLEVII
jgi:hypothetical protein